MTTSQLHEFARLGGEARLKTIQEEQQGGFNRLTQHHTDRRRYGCALVETVLVRTD